MAKEIDVADRRVLYQLAFPDLASNPGRLMDLEDEEIERILEHSDDETRVAVGLANKRLERLALRFTTELRSSNLSLNMFMFVGMHPTNLRALNLSGCSTPPQWMMDLILKCSELRSLGVRNTKLTEEDVRVVMRTLTNLEEVHFDPDPNDADDEDKAPVFDEDVAPMFEEDEAPIFDEQGAPIFEIDDAPMFDEDEGVDEEEDIEEGYYSG